MPGMPGVPGMPGMPGIPCTPQCGDFLVGSWHDVNPASLSLEALAR